MTAYDIGSKVFGGWELTRLIGQGGFGSVFEAEKSGYGLTVKSAVKVVRIPPSQSMVTSALAEGMDEASVASYFGGLVEDFMGEVALLSSLGHPGVVEYHDHEIVRDEEGIGWSILLRMELLECLTDRILREPLSRDEALRLGEEVADVLAYCHERNIIHRDVKPENVFVDAEGRFKLGDFGVSRVVEGTSGTLSQKGTVGYMAPELYRGDRYDASVDVYALGLVLYRLLNSNRLPFLPPAPAPITFADRNRASARRMAGEEVPRLVGVDDATFSVIRAACAFDPTARPSAAALRDALQDLRQGTAAQHTSVSQIDLDGQTVNLGDVIQGSTSGTASAATAATTTAAPGMTIGVWDVFGEKPGQQVAAGPTSDDGNETHKAEGPESETEPIRISEASFEPIPVQRCRDGEARPAIVASFDGAPLQENIDFSVTYDANDAPGKAKALIKGLGRFKGVKTLSFIIEGKKGTKTEKPKPIEPTSSELNAIAERFFENGSETWQNDRFGYVASFGSRITSKRSAKAHANLGIKQEERTFFLYDTADFFYMKSGFACCTTGVYYKGVLRQDGCGYLSWDSFRKLPYEAIGMDAKTHSWTDPFRIGPYYFPQIGGQGKNSPSRFWGFLGAMLHELWTQLNDPSNWTGEERSLGEDRAPIGAGQSSRTAAQEFLKNYVRDFKKGSLKNTETFGNHTSHHESATRRYLSIPQDETIYATYSAYSASIYKDKEPDFRLDTIAVSERGLYVPKKIGASHTSKLVGWQDFSHFARKRIAYDERLIWVYLDGDSNPFALYDDFPFWKGLFDGLVEALK